MPSNYTETERTFRRCLLFGALLFCILLPLLNNFALRLFYSYEVDGNTAYGYFGTVLENVIEFVNIVCVYVSFALLTISVFLYKLADSLWIILCAAGLRLIGFLSGVAVCALTTYGPNFAYYTLYGVLNLLWELLLLFVVIAAVCAVRRRFSKNGYPSVSTEGRIVSLKTPVMRSFFFTALIYTAAAFLKNALDSADSVINYGTPISVNDWVYLISPYIETAVYLVVGYCAMLAAAVFFEGRRSKIIDKKR